jgi:hypothetical protein
MARAKADAGGEKKPSMMAMVRDTLQELGGNPSPQEIQTHIKSKYNRDIPTQIISNYKSVIRGKRTTGGTGNGRRRGRPPGSGSGLRVEHFEAIRALVRQLGAEQVKRLVDVVA